MREASQIAQIPLKARAYILLLGPAGLAVLAYSLLQEPVMVQPGWLGLAALTALTSAFGLRVKLPTARLGGLAVTVSDCFVFAAIVIFHPAAAAALAAVDALVANLRFRIRRPDRFVFNIAQMVLVAWAVAHFFRLFRGHLALGLNIQTPLWLLICASIYFILNSGLVAVGMAMTAELSFLSLWAAHFPWICPASLLNASAAMAAALGSDVLMPLPMAVAGGFLALAASHFYLRKFQPRRI